MLICLRSNVLGWRIEARYNVTGDDKINDPDDLCERYVYDRSWRLVAIYRNLPGYSEMLPEVETDRGLESPGPKADVLYQRLVYHSTGVGGMGNAGGGGHDALVLRQRWLPIVSSSNPPTPGNPPPYATELLWYVQNRRVGVVGLLEECFDGSGNPAGRSWRERLWRRPSSGASVATCAYLERCALLRVVRCQHECAKGLRDGDMECAVRMAKWASCVLSMP